MMSFLLLERVGKQACASWFPAHFFDAARRHPAYVQAVMFYGNGIRQFAAF
jgi:hypothetical protein